MALCQIDPTVADVSGNCERILAVAERAAAAGADLAVFSELVVSGYPPRDLLERPSFIDAIARAVTRLAAAAPLPLIVGAPMTNPTGLGRPLHNSALLLHRGHVVSRHDKMLLPTYDVFDEDRHFEPGAAVHPAPLGELRLGVSVCEDIWKVEASAFTLRRYLPDPIADLAEAGVDVLVNISASPWSLGKERQRLEVLRDTARRHQVPVVYVNQVGGNDEILFDGNSMVVLPDGSVVAHARAFAEDLVVFEWPPANGAHGGELAVAERPAQLHAALTMGIRDYCRKCGFTRAVLGLSGGIDSAVTAALAAAALGPANVTGIAMPSRFSSPGSMEDARALATNLGIGFEVVEIQPVVDAYERALDPVFHGRPRDVTEENLQARVRGNVLMAYSNKHGHLVLSTGNKSELAVGYCTLYGDMSGGLAVISDLLKRDVYALARWMNRAGEVIPRASIEKPPSAELRPNQKDEDSLPPYAVLDPILEAYVEQQRSVEDIIDLGFDAAVVREVVRLVLTSEYKRRQAAPGLRVTAKAFGGGRRIPIAMRYRV